MPVEKKIIFYSKANIVKNLLCFLFKVVVGIVFNSGLLIAIGLYNLFISGVNANCAHGLKKNEDSLDDCATYINGGSMIAMSSICYLGYAIFQIVFPSNTTYNLIIAIIIFVASSINILSSFIGILRAKGKTLLVKEYKITKLATALNNLVLAQIAILSFSNITNVDKFNIIIGLIMGSLILFLGIYLIIDGKSKKKIFENILNK